MGLTGLLQPVINRLLGLPNVEPVQSDGVRAPLAHYAQGMDFADALHLTLSGAHEALISFDKGFVRRAAKFAVSPQVMGARITILRLLRASMACASASHAASALRPAGTVHAQLRRREVEPSPWRPTAFRRRHRAYRAAWLLSNRELGQSTDGCRAIPDLGEARLHDRNAAFAVVRFGWMNG